jgi:hypothetical protein
MNTASRYLPALPADLCLYAHAYSVEPAILAESGLMDGAILPMRPLLDARGVGDRVPTLSLPLTLAPIDAAYTYCATAIADTDRGLAAIGLHLRALWRALWHASLMGGVYLGDSGVSQAYHFATLRRNRALATAASEQRATWEWLLSYGLHVAARYQVEHAARQPRARKHTHACGERIKWLAESGRVPLFAGEVRRSAPPAGQTSAPAPVQAPLQQLVNVTAEMVAAGWDEQQLLHATMNYGAGLPVGHPLTIALQACELAGVELCDQAAAVIRIARAR